MLEMKDGLTADGTWINQISIYFAALEAGFLQDKEQVT